MSWEEVMNLLNQAGGKTAAGLVGQNLNTGEIPPNELINYILGKDTSSEIANYPTAHENIDWEMFLDGIKDFVSPIADVFNPISNLGRIKSGGEEIGEQIASFLVRQNPITNEIPGGIFGSEGNTSIEFDSLKDMIKHGLSEGNMALNREQGWNKTPIFRENFGTPRENADVTDIVSILKDLGLPHGDEFWEESKTANMPRSYERSMYRIQNSLIEDLINQILGTNTALHSLK